MNTVWKDKQIAGLEEYVFFAKARIEILERERAEARQDAERFRVQLREIYYITETYADGSPDASEHDKRCNEIASMTEPYIYITKYIQPLYELPPLPEPGEHR